MSKSYENEQQTPKTQEPISSWHIISQEEVIDPRSYHLYPSATNGCDSYFDAVCMMTKEALLDRAKIMGELMRRVSHDLAKPQLRGSLDGV